MEAVGHHCRTRDHLSDPQRFVRCWTSRLNANACVGEDYSYIILVTDGLNSLMSDQEIVDLARNSIDPTRAAKTIVHFGEDLGAQDNCTCVVVPLAGWGKVGGRDNTEERREYRRKQAGMLNTRMQRM